MQNLTTIYFDTKYCTILYVSAHVYNMEKYTNIVCALMTTNSIILTSFFLDTIDIYE